jgi:glycosyl transferase, family 25
MDSHNHAMSLTDFFDEIVVINLPERTDRRREIAHQFKKVGIDPEQVSFFPAIRPVDAGGFPSIGAPCFLSHLALIDRAAGRGLNRLLICEDDLDFAEDFTARVSPVLSELAEIEWSFFYGGHRMIEGQAFGLTRGDTALCSPPRAPFRRPT